MQGSWILVVEVGDAPPVARAEHINEGAEDGCGRSHFVDSMMILATAAPSTSYVREPSGDMLMLHEDSTRAARMAAVFIPGGVDRVYRARQ